MLPSQSHWSPSAGWATTKTPRVSDYGHLTLSIGDVSLADGSLHPDCATAVPTGQRSLAVILASQETRLVTHRRPGSGYVAYGLAIADGEEPSHTCVVLPV